MELDRIKILVDKYFEGVTSLEEEQELATLLAECDNLPAEYQAIKMMLSSFNELSKATPSKTTKAHIEKRPDKWLSINRRWFASVAAVACIVLGIAILLKPNSNTIIPKGENPNYICYVNGTKVSNDQLAYAEAARILGSVSEDVHLAMEEVNRLTRYTIVK